MNRYELIRTVGSGAFGNVLKCRDKTTGEVVAVKQMHRKYTSWEDCVKLNEVKSLISLSHQNIIRLKEVLRQQNSLYFVFEYADGGSFFDLVERARATKQPLPMAEIQVLMLQAMRGLDYMHSHGFFHRDIKPENILLSGGVAKLADLGLAREIRYVPPLTEYVSTRWYRAPEILLRSPTYGPPIDMWAIGCVVFELYTGKPLFPGISEADVLHRISAAIGSMELSGWEEGINLARRLKFRFPASGPEHLADMIVREQQGISGTKDMSSPHVLEQLKDFIKKCVRWNPKERMTAREAIRHPFLDVSTDDNNKLQPLDPYNIVGTPSGTLGSYQSPLSSSLKTQTLSSMASSDNGKTIATKDRLNEDVGADLDFDDDINFDIDMDIESLGCNNSCKKNNNNSNNKSNGIPTTKPPTTNGTIISDRNKNTNTQHSVTFKEVDSIPTRNNRNTTTNPTVNPLFDHEDEEVFGDDDYKHSSSSATSSNSVSRKLNTNISADPYLLNGDFYDNDIEQIGSSNDNSRSSSMNTKKNNINDNIYDDDDDDDINDNDKLDDVNDIDELINSLSASSTSASVRRPSGSGAGVTQHARKPSHAEAMDLAKNALRNSRADASSSRGSTRSRSSSIDELLNDPQLWDE